MSLSQNLINSLNPRIKLLIALGISFVPLFAYIAISLFQPTFFQNELYKLNLAASIYAYLFMSVFFGYQYFKTNDNTNKWFWLLSSIAVIVLLLYKITSFFEVQFMDTSGYPVMDASFIFVSYLAFFIAIEFTTENKSQTWIKRYLIKPAFVLGSLIYLIVIPLAISVDTYRWYLSVICFMAFNIYLMSEYFVRSINDSDNPKRSTYGQLSLMFCFWILIDAILIIVSMTSNQENLEHTAILFSLAAFLEGLILFNLIKPRISDKLIAKLSNVKVINTVLNSKATDPLILLALLFPFIHIIGYGIVGFVEETQTARSIFLAFWIIICAIAITVNIRLENKILKDSQPSRASIAISAADPDVENVFIAKLKKITEENFADPDFGPEQLSSSMAMSPRNLQRKIKENLDQTPNEFLRQFRLEKAAVFLSNNYQVNQVVEMVGFSSPSYFSKCFKQFFDYSPKQFQAESNKKLGV